MDGTGNLGFGSNCTEIWSNSKIDVNDNITLTVKIPKTSSVLIECR